MTSRRTRYSLAMILGLGLLGACVCRGNDDLYRVKKGDTLARIAKRLYGNAAAWKEIAALNPDLKNPAVLEVGRSLKLKKAGARTVASVEVGLPVVKLSPPNPKDSKDVVIQYVPLHAKKNRMMPTLLVLTPSDRFFGRIKGGYNDGAYFTVHDNVYLEGIGQDALHVGDRFSIVRSVREVKDHNLDAGPSLGTLHKVLGTLRITDKGEKLYTAQIEDSQAPIQREDLLFDLQVPLDTETRVNPPEKLQARILQGTELDSKYFGQGQTVLLNKGSQEGMQPGHLFRVFREEDPVTKGSTSVEPESKGEVVVVQVQPTTSLAYIVRNQMPLTIGDSVIPRQAFRDPPPPPKRSSAPIELD